jgi:hypothetical protein
MPTNVTVNKNIYLRLLLMVPAIGLLGLTGCSTADGSVRHNHSGRDVQIAARAYNSESRSFDRPWPFGPESSEQ